MASARDLFSAFLAVYRHVSSGAIPADKVAEISVKNVGKFADVREELKRLPGGVRFCLEWAIGDPTIDVSIWADLLDVSRQTAFRIEALRWASGLLGLPAEEAEYDVRWVGGILPRVRTEFQKKYGAGMTGARRDIESFVALQGQRRHLETLENWASLFNEEPQPATPPQAKTKEVELVIEPATTTRPTAKPASQTVIELDAAPMAANPTVVQPTVIELDQPTAPTPKPASPKAPSNALDLESFSLEQLRALAQAQVPGATDEIVRRMRAGN